MTPGTRLSALPLPRLPWSITLGLAVLYLIGLVWLWRDASLPGEAQAQQYVSEVRARLARPIDPLPAPLLLEPAPLDMARDPFAP